MVNDAIDGSECRHRVFEYALPGREDEIGRDQNAAPLIALGTSLLIMRPSLAKISNWTKKAVRCFIVPDDYPPEQSFGPKRHSQRCPARRRYGR